MLNLLQLGLESGVLITSNIICDLEVPVVVLEILFGHGIEFILGLAGTKYHFSEFLALQSLLSLNLLLILLWRLLHEWTLRLINIPSLLLTSSMKISHIIEVVFLISRVPSTLWLDPLTVLILLILLLLIVDDQYGIILLSSLITLLVQSLL